MIIIGATILYLSIIFVVIPSTSPHVVSVCCNLTPWLTAIGYSLCYGTILAKMARVYYIFNDPTTKKKV
jgi:gamma-aminobutyric acid type B receptor